MRPRRSRCCAPDPVGLLLDLGDVGTGTQSASAVSRSSAGSVAETVRRSPGARISAVDPSATTRPLAISTMRSAKASASSR